MFSIARRALGRRRLILLLSVAAVAAGALPAQAATPPPTVSGEFFQDFNPTITATCNPDGTSTLSFTATGPAVGPYPGTFTETATATIGPQDLLGAGPSGLPAGPLNSYQATFTIDSPIGQVTGTKAIPAMPPGRPIGACRDFAADPVLGAGRVRYADTEVRWDAVIQNADGRWADGGTGVTTLVDLRSDAQTFGQFNEHFQTSDTGVPKQICSRSSGTAGV